MSMSLVQAPESVLDFRVATCKTRPVWPSVRANKGVRRLMEEHCFFEHRPWGIIHRELEVVNALQSRTFALQKPNSKRHRATQNSARSIDAWPSNARVPRTNPWAPSEASFPGQTPQREPEKRTQTMTVRALTRTNTPVRTDQNRAGKQKEMIGGSC